MDEKEWREKKAQNWLLESSDDDDEFVLVKKISSEGGKKLNPNLNNGNYKTSSVNLFNRASPNVLPSIYPSLKNFSENWKGKSKNNSNQTDKGNEKDEMKALPPVYPSPFHGYPINGYSLPLNLENMSQVQADIFPQKPSQQIFPSAPLNESSLAPPSYVSHESSEGGGSIETSSITNMDKIPWDEELELNHQNNKEDDRLTTKHLAPWKCSSPLSSSSSRCKAMKSMDEEKLTSKIQIFKCHLKMEFENGYRKGLIDANEMMMIPGSSASSSPSKLVNPTTPTTTINNDEIGVKGGNGLYAFKKDKKAATKYPKEDDGSKKIRTTVLVKIIHEGGKKLKLKVIDKKDDEITSDDSSSSSCYSSDRA